MKFLPGILAITLLIASAHAQTQTPAPRPKGTPPPTPVQHSGEHDLTHYLIPKNAVFAPRIDVDAGTRGWSMTMPSLYVLAPNHTGLTTRAQPSLFWYQSGPSSTRIELTIIEPKKLKPPLLRVGADIADQAGIHRLSLERFNVVLTPGVLYKWTVALVPDRANRSQDLIASDTIMRIEPDAQLAAALARSKGMDKAAIYASNGIWYDALETVTTQIDASPKDREIRRQRAALIEQAGLKDAAAFERR